ncbi:MAG: response regulator transcription factor [Comamonadaceae bacterium]|nr:MAG: response regulator transcription factor [Comamonadaceae bacterium]
MTLPTFLVEDSAIIRTNLVQTLSELAGIELLGHAASEAEAIEWLVSNAGRWRLLIVDLFLADGNGLGVLAACRVRKSGQRVVVLSNYATDSMRQRCIEGYGADAVFDKSTEIEALIDYCLKLKSAR